MLDVNKAREIMAEALPHDEILAIAESNEYYIFHLKSNSDNTHIGSRYAIKKSNGEFTNLNAIKVADEFNKKDTHLVNL